MKPTLKIIAILFCLQFSLTASAQSNTKDFAGIWEFTLFGTDLLKMGPAAQGVLKVTTDSTFTVVRRQLTGAVITQTGTFRVPNQNYFFQKTLVQLPIYGTAGLGEDFKIYYRFSPDKKTITQSYTGFDGIEYFEIWRKL